MDLPAHILAASGDNDGLELWFWLIAGAIYLITTVIKSLKRKEEEKEKPILDAEDNHEKRVKEVIAEMRRTTPQPQPRPPHPARHHAPPHAPRPSAPPVELPTPSVARTRPPEPDPTPEWTGETVQQAAQNVLEQYMKATEEAQRSMRALSDAEQAALHRLQEREFKESHPEPLPAIATPEPLSLKNSLRRSQSLKTAILYQEILGKPRALRGISSGEG